MGVDNVGNNEIRSAKGIAIRGLRGNQLSNVENILANGIGKLDGKDELSKSDIEKLKNMKPEDQIKYLNDALKDTGYQIANVYDSETEETTSGVHWSSNGLYINFSKGGKEINTDIMGDNDKNTGHLGISYKK